MADRASKARLKCRMGASASPISNLVSGRLNKNLHEGSHDDFDVDPKAPVIDVP